jgi:two-component system, OmpR family, KDP operon response regulator KdpE
MARPVVLLVEDDRDMRNVLLVALQGRGYEVVATATGSQALSRLRQAPADVMILDLGLPDIDGVDVALNVRQHHDLPIIVLSARREEEQQVKAFDAGANDYVTKPFREAELMARVRAALRYGQCAREFSELKVGDIRMDTVDRRVFLNDVEVLLSPIEFKLLRILLGESGGVVTHGRLLREVWGPGSRNELQYLRVYMRQLRVKMEEDAARPKRILTALGVGYRVVA